MKIIIIILLIILGIFLYKRAQILKKRQQVEPFDSKFDAKNEPKDQVAKPTTASELKPAAAESSAQEPPKATSQKITSQEVASQPEASDSDAGKVMASQGSPASALEATDNIPMPDSSWANDTLTQAVKTFISSDDTLEKNRAILGAIANCYQHRSQSELSHFGASLAPHYASFFTQNLDSMTTTASDIHKKGSGFMQMATMLSDEKKFEQAIEICQLALAHKLTDGTQTGFAGRIKRIEKAQAKASS